MVNEIRMIISGPEDDVIDLVNNLQSYSWENYQRVQIEDLGDNSKRTIISRGVTISDPIRLYPFE